MQSSNWWRNTLIMTSSGIDEYYSREFWEKSTVLQNPKTYKSNIFFENIGKKSVLPDGLKVQLGVAFGDTFTQMKQYWGVDQVLGIDLYNFNNDPNIWTIDIKKLLVKLPCAYIENDIGASYYDQGKQDRWAATQWGIKSLVPGGILITNAGHMIGFPVEDFAVENACEVKSMTEFDHLDWANFLNTETPYKTSGWCVITKKLSQW